MNSCASATTLLTDPSSLPMRKGKRPLTIPGPLHLECSEQDDRLLCSLVEPVMAWPGLEARPSPVGSADLVSLSVGEGVATDDASAFITGREFGRVLFGAPTIYLALPLIWAHWTMVRGWAEPHFSSSFGLVPPGVMVVYTPRDEHEAALCRSLFWVSYTRALQEKGRNATAWDPPWLRGEWNGEVQKAVSFTR